jgi:hypothetical protein
LLNAQSSLFAKQNIKAAYLVVKLFSKDETKCKIFKKLFLYLVHVCWIEKHRANVAACQIAGDN